MSRDGVPVGLRGACRGRAEHEAERVAVGPREVLTVIAVSTQAGVVLARLSIKC